MDAPMLLTIVMNPSEIARQAFNLEAQDTLPIRFYEEAAKNAVAKASKTLRDLRIAEISQLDLKIEDGKVTAYRTRVNLSFKYEGE